jgi:hypothetical protein
LIVIVVIVVLFGSNLLNPLPEESATPSPSASPTEVVTPTASVSTVPIVKAVTVSKDDFQVTGELILPGGEGPFPAILLIAGSGPNDMDESTGPNKPFKDIAYGLAEEGIAVLRYNKISLENPQALVSNPNTTVNEEYVVNAHDAIELLAQNPSIDPNRIFVLGHSQGGSILPRIANNETIPAGYIFMAGSNADLLTEFIRQYDYLLNLDGVLTDQEKQAMDSINSMVKTIQDSLVPGNEPFSDYVLGVPYSYWKDLADNDPLVLAKTMMQPVLILQGERDYQVLPESADKWEQALSSNKDDTMIK